VPLAAEVEHREPAEEEQLTKGADGRDD